MNVTDDCRGTFRKVFSFMDRDSLRLLAIVIGACLIMGICLGCEHAPQHPAQEPTDRYQKVPEGEFPTFSDDLDQASLRAAIEQSLAYYARAPADRPQPLGAQQLSSEHVKASLLEFLKLLDSGSLSTESIKSRFDVYRAESARKDKLPLVTGYYEPILDGRLKPDSQFQYPLYGLPSDLVAVDLSLFNAAKYGGESIVGRVKDAKLIPYFTRADIDGQKRLKDTGTPLVWIQDPVDGFVLHIQGSGMIRLPHGQFRRLGYAGANGRPYKSLGKVLLDRGAMHPDEMSLQAIRAYLRSHPEERDELLWQNESYVFFHWVNDGPLGSLNVPLTGGRSIATDTRYQPRGGIAFLEGQKPLIDERGELVGYAPLRRWVLNQDTGGAIKGVGRVDLFCGSGEAAEWVAGRMKHPGTLYFLIKKGMN